MTNTIEIKNGLLTAALTAMENAHAPYSRFQVGAAVLDTAGDIYSGCNVENAAYPEGLCAEAAAIAAMVTAGGRKIRQICIVSHSKQLIPPCGGCRQKINEFADANTSVFVCTPEGLQQRYLLAELLPNAFDESLLRSLQC